MTRQYWCPGCGVYHAWAEEPRADLTCPDCGQRLRPRAVLRIIPTNPRYTAGRVQAETEDGQVLPCFDNARTMRAESVRGALAGVLDCLEAHGYHADPVSHVEDYQPRHPAPDPATDGE